MKQASYFNWIFSTVKKPWTTPKSLFKHTAEFTPEFGNQQGLENPGVHTSDILLDHVLAAALGSKL